MDPDPITPTPHLSCGLSRPDTLAVPAVSDNALASLLAVEPPDELRAAHCAWHFLSFAAHVQRLVADPVEVRVIDGRRHVHILGQCVLSTDETGQLRLRIWWRADEDEPFELHAVEPVNTPFLDFPRTDLWLENLRDMLRREAAERGATKAWADWAWSWVHLKVTSRVDVRRLRARIRGALQLDREVLRLLRLRAELHPRAVWSIPDYNLERRWRDTTLLIEREAPALLPVWWGLRERPDLDTQLEAKKALRRITRGFGIAPQQWRVIAGSGRRGLRVYRAVSREFFVGDDERRVSEYLILFKLLGPTRLPSMELLRQLLGMTGTRWDAPPSGYGHALERRKLHLRHVIRVLERRNADRVPTPADELHAVLAWIADVPVANFTPSERAGGWTWLLRQALQYRRRIQSHQQLGGPQSWRARWPAFRHGGLEVQPIVSSDEVWSEAIEMRHCADQYVQDCIDGGVLMFSVRRASGKRLATIAFVSGPGGWSRIGCAGKANSEPPQQVFEVAEQLAARLAAVPTVIPASLVFDPRVDELGGTHPQEAA